MEIEMEDDDDDVSCQNVALLRV